METAVTPEMKRSLANHVLVRELNHDHYQAYRLKDPKRTRIMSTLIVFTPEGIAIMGDLTPSNHGNISAMGYGCKWFLEAMEKDYLASKFLTQAWQPELAAIEIASVLKEHRDELDEKKIETVEEIIGQLETSEIDAGEMIHSFGQINLDSWVDDVPGHGYKPNELGWLAAIQQKFVELYNGPKITATDDEYVIVSPYHSGANITFWRPQGSNYADPIEWIGTYTREEAAKHINYMSKEKLKDFPIPKSTITAARCKRVWVEDQRVWVMPSTTANVAATMVAFRKSFPQTVKPLPLPG